VAWSICARLFGLCGCVLVAAACGDSNANISGVALTVLVPSGPNRTPDSSFAALTTSMEYTVNCDPGSGAVSSNGNFGTVEGTLARTGSFDGGLSGPTAIWKDLVELQPGSCVIQLISRDRDGELLCDIEQPLNIEPGTRSELFLEMPCHTYDGHCTTTPLPGSDASPKNVCESLVGVILSAETPAAFEGLQSVRYLLSEIWELPGASDPELIARHEGALLFAGTGNEDFGDGSVATDTWGTAIEEVAAGPEFSPKPYLLELTAFDAQGEPQCAMAKRFEIVADAVAQIQVALPCVDSAGGAL
jgi:hypothetical protein